MTGAERQSLAGQWRFAADERGEGVKGEWFKTRLPDTIQLPGTTDEGHKGRPNTNLTEVTHLSRLFLYKGPAWYQREITIPVAWQGKRITLLLERTKRTTVWVDNQAFGEQDSLAASHVYDLSAALTPGVHRLTILVDNQKLPPVSGHQVSEDTQTDWNGILGRIELSATDVVWLDDIQVFPDAANRKLRVQLVIGNLAAEPANGTITLSASSGPNASPTRFAPTRGRFAEGRNGARVELEYKLGSKAQLWDEFNPALYQLTASLKARAGTNQFSDVREVNFGVRHFSTRGTQFVINGRPTFLRGKNDTCVFPLTGYPPMDTAGWRRYFETCRAYGINHIRFHTWCPPEAAFEMADQLGFYLQPELPNNAVGDWARELPRQEFSRAEGRRILQAFGNHPSFVMFALGNENLGGREVRADIVGEFRTLDNRHLYAQSSNYEYGAPRLAAGDDYWTTMRTATGAVANVRGSFSHADKPLGYLQEDPPSTLHDYRRAIQSVLVPVIGHEIGQYQVFPNFDETTKYTGVLKPWNFEVFRHRLEAKGLLEQDRDFVRASGALAVRCYREEIEAALRTPGFGGFQLLDLQDFPGQGTALVGILDAFMDSKGLIAPQAWREFCAPVVPLARFSKYTWTTDETFNAQVLLANYGPAGLSHPVIAWRLTGPAANTLAAGRLRSKQVQPGTVTAMGSIGAALKGVATPSKLQLTLSLEGTEFRNHYDLWVYPAGIQPTVPAGVTIARSLDEPTLKTLAAGGKVLLLPEPACLNRSVEGYFTSDFWCYPMFRNICKWMKVPPAPGTLGLLVQDKHPALAGFPTDSHSDWQWWSIVMRSRPVILDEAPQSFRPLVQVIDNFERNHRLGLVFEARVGPGRLLVCAADLPGLRDKPEARQLWASLLAYMGTDQFAPTQSWPVESVVNWLGAAPDPAGQP